MPENDITKMKVADLKRELKLRGLATTGNKIELQDRLQTALIDGELLEDAAMSGEEELLTDEEEAKILGADENELLKSPTTTPTVPELTNLSNVSAGSAAASGGTHEDALLESPTTPTAPGKKIVLKRKNSFTTNISNTTSTTNESTEPTEGKVIKMSERHPIIINAGSDINKSEDPKTSSNETKKLSQLSLQERLDLRAKKFGVSGNIPAKTDSTSAKTTEVGDEKQIELLKKRAERFGCVVSSKMVKLDAQEKLLKRKERFGGADNTVTNTPSTKSSTPVSSDVWAEKARLRLERFKGASNTTSTVTVKSNTSATVAGAD